jgi:hypothetical protein
MSHLQIGTKVAYSISKDHVTVWILVAIIQLLQGILIDERRAGRCG